MKLSVTNSLDNIFFFVRHGVRSAAGDGLDGQTGEVVDLNKLRLAFAHVANLLSAKKNVFK